MSASCSIEPDFAQVAELRPLVLAVLDLAGELRQGDHGHGQLLGQGLEPLGDHGHLLHPVVGARALAAGHQLQVVDHHQIEARLALQPARPRRQLGEGQAAGVIEVERRLLDLQRRVAHPAELRGVDLALAQLVRRHARGLGQDTHGQLLGRHFQRIEGHHPAGGGLLGPVGQDVVGVVARHVEGDVGRQGRLAHRRAPGEDHQVRRVQAADHLVQIGEAGGDAGQAAVAAVGLCRHLDRALQGVGEGDEAGGALAGLGQGVERLLGDLDLVLGGMLLVAGGRLGDLAADADQVAAQGARS